MATDMKRVMVSITPELEEGLDAVKKDQFYNKPYSEVYRYIFSLGLEVVKEQKNIDI
ncbi:MAG: hypothetical protein RR115_08610 [Hydrogenoanaerobacterium sp.]